MSTLYSRDVKCIGDDEIGVWAGKWDGYHASLSCYSTCGDSCIIDIDEDSIVRIIDALNEALTVLREAKSNE
jgi:hypothetical protein